MWINGGVPNVDKKRFTQYSFGVCITPSVNSQLVTYAIIGTYEGQITSRQFISIDNFILQASGRQFSAANPERKNLFMDYNVSDCYPLFDTIRDRYVGYSCITVDDLWKIRYAKHPQKNEFGWCKSQWSPKAGQLAILMKYGIGHISQYIYGENLWKLLKDMQDPAWIEAYRKA